MPPIFAIISMLVQLLPIVQQLVGAAEALFPQSGAGAQKLDFVKNALGTAYTTANTTQVAFEHVWPTVNGAITTIVAAGKAIKAGAPAPAPAAAAPAPAPIAFDLPAGAAIAQPALA